MSYQMPLTNLQNVAPGNVATLKLPAGPGSPTYDQVKLELSGGMTAAHIESIKGKINGRIFTDEATGTVLQLRDAYRGITTEAGYVVLDFTEPKTRNGAVEQLFAAVPGNLCQSIDFEIKIASGAPGGGRIKALAQYRPPTTNGWVRKVLNTSQSFSAAGTEASPNIMYLPNGANGGKIKRLWLHESTAGVITGVQVRVANNVVHEATRAQIENDQKRNDLVPQAGVLVLDWMSDGNMAALLDTSTMPNVELRLVMSAAATITSYMEIVDPIGNL